MNKQRLDLDEEICKKQHERLLDIRGTFCDVDKFEHSSIMIDKEIEYLILYFTPSVRRNNDELGTVMTKVMQNEKILQLRHMEETMKAMKISKTGKDGQKPLAKKSKSPASPKAKKAKPKGSAAAPTAKDKASNASRRSASRDPSKSNKIEKAPDLSLLHSNAGNQINTTMTHKSAAKEDKPMISKSHKGK